MEDTFGLELIMDLHDCDPKLFNRKDIEHYLKELCRRIDMKRGPLHFWDYEDYPKLKAKAPPNLCGTSVVQFISTSNIMIHTLDKLKAAYINIFTCKDFDTELAAAFTEEFFKGHLVNSTVVRRV